MRCLSTEDVVWGSYRPGSLLSKTSDLVDVGIGSCHGVRFRKILMQIFKPATKRQILLKRLPMEMQIKKVNCVIVHINCVIVHIN
jgi:hypothetical protein